MNEKLPLLRSDFQARWSPAQVGKWLNCSEADVNILVRKKFLTPLGGKNIAQNAHKWFASSTVIALSEDTAWLSKITTAIYTNTRERNSKIGEAKLESC